MIDLIEARYVAGYTVWIRSEDGTMGEVDLSNAMIGPLFEPLHDRNYFKRFFLNRDTGTIEWPNGADFAPEFLREKLHATAR